MKLPFEAALTDRARKVLPTKAPPERAGEKGRETAAGIIFMAFGLVILAFGGFSLWRDHFIFGTVLVLVAVFVAFAGGICFSKELLKPAREAAELMGDVASSATNVLRRGQDADS